MATLSRPAVGGNEIELLECADLDTIHELSPTVLMRQSRWHGRFLELHNEMAYHRWHTAKMIPRAQRALFLVGVFSMGALAAATATGRHFALQNELIRAYPDKGWVLYLSRIAAAFFPMLLSVALFFKPVSRAIEARRLFQPLIFMVCGVAISIQSIPKTWLAIWGTEQARNLDEGAGLAYGEDHECSSTLHTRSVYWHAITLDSYAAIGSGMIGLRPEFAVVLVLYTVALQHAQLEALWTHSLVQWGTDDGKQLVPYIMRAMPMLTALLLSAVQDRNERKTFVAKTLLQLANTERIEQLKRDKDRYVSICTTLPLLHICVTHVMHPLITGWGGTSTSSSALGRLARLRHTPCETTITRRLPLPRTR